MTHRLAAAIYATRYWLCAVIAVGFVWFVPQTSFTNLDNDLTMWMSKDDPVYRTYERFRNEFGGQRTLIIALKSDHLFTPAALEFIRTVSSEIERVQTVQRVDSLATVNVVDALPADPSTGEPGGLDVRRLLDVERPGPTWADRVRRRALSDPLFKGDLVSDDGRVTAIVVSFDEDRVDAVRTAVIDRIHQIIDPRLPEGVEAFYNGALEISETYNRVTIDNTLRMTPPILALTVAGIFLLFRSWRVTVLLVGAVLVSTVWTMGLYVSMGFKYNVIASMIPPLILILAIADDVHIVQHFTHELREHQDGRQAFISTVEHLMLPLLGASGTTALGLISLATSDVVAVRTFGTGAAVGVMVDFVLSLTLVPTLLLWLRPEISAPPQERYLMGPMQRLARLSITRAKPILACTVLLMLAASAGMYWLRVDTNHINFFSKDHPLHRSAEVVDGELSGVYSFNILLEGPPDSLRTPDAMQRLERLRVQLEGLPYVKKVVSVADYVKRVNQQLHDGAPEGYVVPASGDAIAQELFVFGLSDDGRHELERVAASDYSRAQVSVKLASLSSDLVFEQINTAERLANQAFAGSGIRPTVTGGGRIFATVDHYLVTSQLSSFGTAFVTVFAVIFVLFRSVPFGVLGIVANALPVCAVLGIMGWVGISLNVATIMVASVALGIVDDDTIHFIGRFKRETEAGLSAAEAIEVSTMHEGRASLTTAVVNTVAYSVMLLSSYRPSAWFGGLLALTMAVAFLAEVFVVPAVIMMAPRRFEPRRVAARMETAA